VRTIVCAFSGELPTAWLAVFHRFERRIQKEHLRVRVRVFALDALPEQFEVLIVPPELAERARAVAPEARIVATTRAEAAAADDLVREILEGRSLYADPVRPGDPKIVTHRGMEEL
jgi:mannitol-specific phosphotransferase system IIBC component